MNPKRTVSLILRAAALSLGLYALLAPAALSAADSRIYELRIYTCNEGKLDALHARFRDHTNEIFVRHGMTLIGFWTPTKAPEKDNTLIYILAYPSMEAREKAWAAFRNDPHWKKAQAESEKNGKLVNKVESRFMTPTDFSPLQ